MSANTQKSPLILVQSTTKIAKTPPLSSTAIKKESNSRLELYSCLFNQGASQTCDDSGLQLVSSLNYSLYTFLHLCDNHWVLAIICMNESENFEEKYGHGKGKRKIIQIGTVIKKFCNNDPRKLKGFNCNDVIINDKQHNEEILCNLFAILIYCHPQLIKCEKYIGKLIKKIEQQTNESVSVGIAKMNEWETFEEWKNRAIKNMKQAKNTSETENSSTFYSDVNVKYVNPKRCGDEKIDKKEEDESGVVQMLKLGTVEEFDAKMQEL